MSKILSPAVRLRLPFDSGEPDPQDITLCPLSLCLPGHSYTGTHLFSRWFPDLRPWFVYVPPPATPASLVLKTPLYVHYRQRFAYVSHTTPASLILAGTFLRNDPMISRPTPVVRLRPSSRDSGEPSFLPPYRSGGTPLTTSLSAHAVQTQLCPPLPLGSAP